jgi:hypothetical protein
MSHGTAPGFTVDCWAPLDCESSCQLTRDAPYLRIMRARRTAELTVVKSRASQPAALIPGNWRDALKKRPAYGFLAVASVTSALGCAPTDPANDPPRGVRTSRKHLPETPMDVLLGHQSGQGGLPAHNLAACYRPQSLTSASLPMPKRAISNGTSGWCPCGFGLWREIMDGRCKFKCRHPGLILRLQRTTDRGGTSTQRGHLASSDVPLFVLLCLSSGPRAGQTLAPGRE